MAGRWSADAGVVVRRRAGAGACNGCWRRYMARSLDRGVLAVPTRLAAPPAGAGTEDRLGNITAGGTGKTPLTIALVERLREAGWKAGRGQPRLWPRRGRHAALDHPGAGTGPCGDEPRC